jgi:hypothetical protein
MDNNTVKVQERQWLERIMACNQSGQTRSTWCQENGVSLKSFYYWQNKLRWKMTAAMGTKTEEMPQADFVPLRLPGPKETRTAAAPVVMRAGGMEIEIHETASEALIGRLLRVVTDHAG